MRAHGGKIGVPARSVNIKWNVRTPLARLTWSHVGNKISGEQAVSMKICPYCGKENSDEAKVCVIDQQPLAPEPQAIRAPKPSREDVQRHLAARPLEVEFGVGLLAVGMAITFLKDFVIDIYRFNPFRYPGFYISLTFAFALYLVLFYFVFRGRNWARWVTVILIALSFLCSPFLFHSHMSLMSCFYLLLDVVAMVALFRRPSNEWFAKAKCIAEPPVPAP
jgi:hypothetical protein